MIYKVTSVHIGEYISIEDDIGGMYRAPVKLIREFVKNDVVNYLTPYIHILAFGSEFSLYESPKRTHAQQLEQYAI